MKIGSDFLFFLICLVNDYVCLAFQKDILAQNQKKQMCVNIGTYRDPCSVPLLPLPPIAPPPQKKKKKNNNQINRQNYKNTRERKKTSKIG
jgi:hypothetical protein